MARGADDLVLKVKADTATAVKSFDGLAHSIDTVDKEAKEATTSLSRLDRAKVRPDTTAAARQFEQLGRSVDGVERKVEQATTSMARLDRTKVAPEVKPRLNEAAIASARAEIDRLRAQIARDIPVGADTKPAQRRIAELEAAIKKLSVKPVEVPVKVTGLAKAKAELESLGVSATSVTGSLAGLTGAASKFSGSVTGPLGLVAAAGAASVAFNNMAADMQTAQLQMKYVIRDGGNVSQLLEEIRDFGAESPFEFPELQSSAKQLAGFGVASKDLIQTMRNLGEVASATGVSIEDISRVYGQMLSKGTIQQEQLNQLAEKGVPVYEALAKALGKSETEVRSMISSGQLGRKEVKLLGDELGKMFGGATAAQAETFNGQWSTFTDTMHELGVSLGETTLPAMTEMLRLANDIASSEWFKAIVMISLTSPTWTFLSTVIGETDRKMIDLRDHSTDAGAAFNYAAEQANAQAVAQRVLNQQVEDAQAEITGYISKLDILNGRLASGRELTANYEEAIDNLTDATKENGRSLDLSTEKGRRNDEAFRRAAETLDALTRRRLEDAVKSGQSTDKIVADYKAQRDALVKTGLELAGNDKKAQAYVKTLLATPEEIATSVEVTGAKEAEARIDALTKPRTVVIKAQLDRSAALALEDFRTQGRGGTTRVGSQSVPGPQSIVVRPRIYVDGTPIRATVRSNIAPVPQERGRL